jgi:MFS family permease
MKLTKYKFSPLIWLAVIGTAFLRIGTSMSIPFLSIFLHYRIHISLGTTGMIVGMSYLSYTLGGFWGGALSDKYGREKIFKISLLAYALSFLAFGFVASCSHRALIIVVTFFIINLLAGLFRIWAEVLTQAMLSDLVDDTNKITAFSLRYTMANIGNAIGPVIGAIIGASGSVAGFYYTGGVCMIYFAVFYYLTKNHVYKTHMQRNVSSIKKMFFTLMQDKILLFYVIGGIFSYLIYVQQEATLGQIIMARFGSVHMFSMLLTINALTIVFLQIPLTQYCLKRYKATSLMQIGCVFLAVGFIGMAWAHTIVSIYVLSEIIFTIGEICVFSIAGLFIDSIAQKNLRGAYFGAIGFQYLGKAIGPFLGGLFLAKVGGAIALSMFAVSAIIPLLIYRYKCTVHDAAMHHQVLDLSEEVQ